MSKELLKIAINTLARMKKINMVNITKKNGPRTLFEFAIEL